MSRRTQLQPAGGRTLAAWWWIGLVLGITAVGFGVTGFGSALTDGRGHSLPTVLLLGAATLAALVSAVFLRRVWSEPAHRTGPWTRRGRRASDVLVTAWGVGVVLNAVAALGGPSPAPLAGLLAAAFVTALAGMLLAAWLDRPDRP